MEKFFNKLVRDKIPEIIQSKGEMAVTRVLNDNEYKKELLKKLQEETLEVTNANTSQNLLEELADVLEVVKALSKLENKTIEDLISLAQQKNINRGGFDNKVFLIKTIKE